MKVPKLIEVPRKFFKREYFEVSEKELLMFLSSMKGFVDSENTLYLSPEIDIDVTIQMHSGDCRIWLVGDNGYIVPRFKQLFMLVDEEETDVSDIYDWMKLYIPSLYEKHEKVDESETK